VPLLSRAVVGLLFPDADAEWPIDASGWILVYALKLAFLRALPRVAADGGGGADDVAHFVGGVVGMLTGCLILLLTASSSSSSLSSSLVVNLLVARCTVVAAVTWLAFQCRRKIGGVAFKTTN
jgi:hypothetical protein